MNSYSDEIKIRATVQIMDCLHMLLKQKFFFLNLWTNSTSHELAHPMKDISSNFKGGQWTWTIPAFRKVQLWDEWVRWSWHSEGERDKIPRDVPRILEIKEEDREDGAQ